MNGLTSVSLRYRPYQKFNCVTQPALGVGSTVRNIDGINNGLSYVDGAATYTPIAARSTMLVGYLDTRLKVIRGEFEARLTQVGGAEEVQLSQCTFNIQY